MSERQSLPGYSHPVDALVKAYEIVGVTLDPYWINAMRKHLDEPVEYNPSVTNYVHTDENAEPSES